MKLIFRNSRGLERVISFVKSEEEAFKEMKRFCNEHNFKIFYIRKWKEEHRWKYDVGSWSEFFYLDDTEDENKVPEIKSNTESNNATKKIFTTKNKGKGKFVLEHLEKYGSITSLEAIELYGATRLSDIIYKLRKKGYKISTLDVPHTDKNGIKSHYGKYILEGH